MKIPKDCTIREKYAPAMKITDPQEAAEYFEECVQHTMSFGTSREEAEKIEKSNLGYYAGYYDNETRLRVEKLFNCIHPIFGSAIKPPTPEEAFEMGQKLGTQLKVLQDFNKGA